MNRKLSSFLIISIFLSVQAFALLHASQYGFEKHEHNGNDCDICLSVDHNKLLSTSPAKLVTPNSLTFKITLAKETLSFFAKIQLFEARAPPFFS